MRAIRWAALVAAFIAGCAPGIGMGRGRSAVRAQPRHTSWTGRNWPTVGGDWRERFYSPLAHINVHNAHTLGLAWQYDAMPRRGGVPRGLEATPVVVDGVLYTSLAWSDVVALDAATGRQLWRYDPKVNGAVDRRACCDVVNRGVAVWNGRVYVGTTNGYLVALDARNGHVLWRVNTLINRAHFYTITGAPQVAGHVVVIGNGGAEFGVRGYVSAYDLKTGALRWRFYTVPGNPKHHVGQPSLKWAARTWNPKSRYWVTGGGGTVWGNMAYDPRLNLLYFGTGNGTPYPVWFRSPGRTTNLFLASILAVNPDTGRLKWYYQETPGEMWDYDADAPLTLATLRIDGRTHKVVMQASKNGFFYILDRATGRLLSARNYVYVNWASGIDLKTGRPILTGAGWYKNKPKLVYPGQAGGHNWMPMSYSPRTGLVYIPVLDTPMLYTAERTYAYRPGEFNMGAVGSLPPIPEQFLDPAHPARLRERLLAWNPIAQKEVWQRKQSGFFNGGVLSTAGGIVFEGTSGGHFICYDARTGRVLCNINIGVGMMAAPATYMVNGQQYVVVLAGYGGAVLKAFAKGVAARTYLNEPRILAFKLNGGPVRLPPRRRRMPLPARLYRVSADQQIVDKGGTLYMTQCARCHGGYWRGVPSGYPDLERLPPSLYRHFDRIVLGGALSSQGMASFADVLDRSDAQAIAAYLQTATNRLIEERHGSRQRHTRSAP